MNWSDLINETSIAVALVVSIVGIVVVAVISGPAAVPTTHLPDLSILLGGALAGTKVPRPSGSP